MGTFNVRGLTKDIKKDQLASDMTKYKIDICCLQECKIKDGCDETIQKARLICLPTKEISHGNGFLVSKKWEKFIYKTYKVSERIAVLQLEADGERYKCEKINDTILKFRKIKKTYKALLKKTRLKRQRCEHIQADQKNEFYRLRKTYKSTLDGMKMKIKKIKEKRFVPPSIKMKFKETNGKHRISIINAYAPHSEITKNNPKETEQFYKQLNNITQKLSHSSVVIIAGDMNAKSGKRRQDEECLGNYGRGRRNKNGEHLIDYCEENDLVIANSCFEHKACHLATWEQTRTNLTTNKITRTYNTIDYIMIKRSQKNLLLDSRTYNGTLTFSDHRLLRTRMNIDWYNIYKQNKNPTPQKKLNTQELITNKEKRDEYSRTINDKLTKMNENERSWDTISTVMKDTAENVIGYVKKIKRKDEYSPKINELSELQMKMRLDINCCTDVQKRQTLKRKRNETMKEIHNELKTVSQSEIDRITKDVESAKGDRHTFKAVQRLKEHKSKENTYVHDKKGKTVHNEGKKYKLVKEHFESQFHKNNTQEVETFPGPPSTLNKRITPGEVKKAVTSMSNNKATGEDGIPIELIKYGPPY